MINKINLIDKGFDLLSDNIGYVEWGYRNDLPTLSTLRVRFYKNDDSNTVIYHRGEEYSLFPHRILFSGRIETIEIFDLIFNLIK